MRITFTVLAVIFLISCTAYPQDDDLGGKLNKIVSLYAVEYLRPFNDAIGTNLNSGFYHTAKIPFSKKKPASINLYIGIKFFGTFFSDDDKKFNLSYSDNVKVLNQFGQQVIVPATYTVTNAPTIFGEKEAPKAIGYYDFGNGPVAVDTVTLVGGVINTNVFPFLIPQIGIGTVYGTDAVIRFIPRFKIPDFGSFGYFGIAIRHNVSRYFKKKLPVSLAVQVGYQGFSLKDTKDKEIISSSGIIANAEVSRTFSVITFYGGFQYETFSTDVNYTYKNVSTGEEYPQNVTLKSTANIRGTLGFTLSLGVFKFNADASFGKYMIVSSGLGIGF